MTGPLSVKRCNRWIFTSACFVIGVCRYFLESQKLRAYLISLDPLSSFCFLVQDSFSLSSVVRIEREELVLLWGHWEHCTCSYRSSPGSQSSWSEFPGASWCRASCSVFWSQQKGFCWLWGTLSQTLNEWELAGKKWLWFYWHHSFYTQPLKVNCLLYKTMGLCVHCLFGLMWKLPYIGVAYCRFLQ